MIYPIGDEQVKGGSKPFFSYLFIGLNFIIFLYQVTLPPINLEWFVLHYGSVPVDIMDGNHLFTLFTSMFIHGGWIHLIGNLLFLWVFGDNIEAIIGNFNFLIFYLAGGLAAAMSHVLSDPSSSVPAIGASGAISAVLGAYLVLFPASKIRVLVIYFFRSFHMPAIFFLGIWIVQQLISGYLSLSRTASQAQSEGVAWWAHIGGFGFGLITGWIARKSIESGHRTRKLSDSDLV